MKKEKMREAFDIMDEQRRIIIELHAKLVMAIEEIESMKKITKTLLKYNSKK